MKKDSQSRRIGFLPIDEECCALLRDQDGSVILESYAYEVGFFRFNWHPSVEILFILKGALKAYTEQGIYELNEDDYMVINANEGHATMFLRPDTRAAVLHLSQERLDQVCGQDVRPFFHYVSSEKDNSAADRAFRSILAAVYLAATEKKPHADLLLTSQFYSLSWLLMSLAAVEQRTRKEEQLSRAQQRAVGAMTDHIDKNFRRRITLADMAALTGMNGTYVSTYFKAHTGIGFHEYLTRRRLAHAADRLNNTDESVASIALDSGFPDVKAFHTAFRKYFSLPPGEYRDTLNRRSSAAVKTLHPHRFSPSDPCVRQKMLAYLEQAPLTDALMRC